MTRPTKYHNSNRIATSRSRPPTGSAKRVVNPGFPAEVELLTFRIVQEALRNVEKHAQASKAEVKVKFGEGQTVVSITDNGRGFDLERSLSDLPRIGKLGLAGMEERVRLLGGIMKIESAPNKGTKLIIELPI